MTNPQPVFTALADASRRALFERLAREGPATASHLAASMPISRQAVSKHLAVLDEAGLVTRTAVGREVRYQAQPEALSDVTAWAERVDAQWQTRLHRLQKKLG